LKSRAFTLLELLLILGIVALMAGAVTLQFRQPYRRVRFEAVAETLVAIDRQVRSRARAANVAGLLQIDLEWHKLTPRFPAGVAATLPEYQLPSGFMLTRLRTSGGEDRGGRVGVVIRPSGVSITYALLLETDEQSRWIVFLGGTGQVVFVENVNEVQKLFKSLREEGVDFN
jgi:type II secretory pathway pseudopilin PulG